MNSAAKPLCLALQAQPQPCLKKAQGGLGGQPWSHHHTANWDRLRLTIESIHHQSPVDLTNAPGMPTPRSQ